MFLLYILLAMSLAHQSPMAFPPLTYEGLTKFTSEFYDQNPISQLAFAVTRDRIAEKLSDLSGSKKGHLKPLDDLSRCSGVASLQNLLRLALFLLRYAPEYGTTACYLYHLVARLSC